MYKLGTHTQRDTFWACRSAAFDAFLVRIPESNCFGHRRFPPDRDDTGFRWIANINHGLHDSPSQGHWLCDASAFNSSLNTCVNREAHDCCIDQWFSTDFDPGTTILTKQPGAHHYCVGRVHHRPTTHKVFGRFNIPLFFSSNYQFFSTFSNCVKLNSINLTQLIVN